MTVSLCHHPAMRGKAGRRVMGWLITAAVAYAAVVALVFTFQRSLQYFPSTDSRDAAERTGGLMQTVMYVLAELAVDTEANAAKIVALAERLDDLEDQVAEIGNDAD